MKFRSALAAVLLGILALASPRADAQVCNMAWFAWNYTPTPQQWQSCWATYAPVANPVFSGTVTLPDGSVWGSAGFSWGQNGAPSNLGVGPSEPVNVVASLATAGTSVTFTADDVVVCTAANGLCNRLVGYSQALNISTTGAGGMDTGTAPTSSFVNVFAIYNPTTKTASILACSVAESGCNANYYGGGNYPAGYTESFFIGSWPTNGTPALVAAYLSRRNIALAQTNVLSVSGTGVSPTNLSISSAVPPMAKEANGVLTLTIGTGSPNTSNYVIVSSDTNLIGKKYLYCPGVAGSQCGNSFTKLKLPTAQQLSYSYSNSGTSPQTTIGITGYEW